MILIVKPAFHLPRAAAVFAILTCLLAGCGQKGPLYLPKPTAAKPAAQTIPPAPATQPAADPVPASR
jgi:predicted small lipoprotein YifL